MTRGHEVVVRLGFISLAGCPQFLNDDFKEGLSDPTVVRIEPDAGVEQGMGGSGGTDGTSGAAGAGGSDVGGLGSSGSSAGGSAGATGAGGSDVGGPGPVVVSAIPADGARGVAADAALVFTFSAPMDTSSVEAAYVSSELPAAQVSFTWSAGDTVLSVRPNAPLQVATGSDPATVVAAGYAVDFTSQARDQAGNALVAEHVGFTVVRSITQQLDAVQDRDLTGNWRDDSTYGLNYCERVDTTICTGDGAATYKAFVTFDLGGVPADLVSISAAELSTTLEQVFGTPFSALGPLQLEHAEYSIIGDDAYSAPGLSAPRSMATGAVVGDTLSADVLADVQADWGARARSQYRLLFTSPTNSDAVADQVVCSWSSLHLTLSYLAP